jgi:perosamine synthetase
MIRVCEPSISELEREYVRQALNSNWLSSIAPPVALFEEAFAKRFGAKHAVAVNSGGSALFLALWALGIRPGDEVIVPTFTMVASAGAVTQCGATPIFVDCEPDTANLDVSKIEERITPQTRAIMPVHIYGHPCDMDAIRALARDYRLFVIEDAAEAHGALYKGKPVGTLGDAGCFSFYANKLITTGEGGMILTDDDKLTTTLRHCGATSGTSGWPGICE